MARKLSGEATPEELLELEQALRKDPDLHYSLQFILDSWQRRENPYAEDSEAIWRKHAAIMRRNGQFPDESDALPEDLFPPRRRGRAFKILILASCLALTFGAVYLSGTSKDVAKSAAGAGTNNPGEIITQNGTRTKLLLPDGTDVWLNAGSKLTYDSTYGGKNREVTLTGEAFFDVVKNKEKPFVIHTGIISIRVLGTAFNVKSYPGDKTIETSLIRGRIEVSYNNSSVRKLLLTPNQKLVIDSHTSPESFDAAAAKTDTLSHSSHIDKTEVIINPLHHFGPDSLITETAWVDNKLIFQDESFHDLAEKMERWYSVKMIFDEPALDSLHFTGSFEKENIQQALSALQLLSHFNFEIRNAEVHLNKIP